MLANLTIKEFVKELSSDAPAPGGGGAAALSGALGASLVSMVCNLTTGKDEYKDFEKEMAEVLDNSTAIRERLLVLMDEDAKAFGGVIETYKMPKNTDEEKAARTNALQQGFKNAAEVPYEIAQECLKILKLSEQIVEKSNHNVISDVGVAVQTAASAVDSALLNVKVNLVFIKDENYIKTMSDEIEKIELEAKNIKEETYKKVLNLLS